MKGHPVSAFPALATLAVSMSLKPILKTLRTTSEIMGPHIWLNQLESAFVALGMKTAQKDLRTFPMTLNHPPLLVPTGLLLVQVSSSPYHLPPQQQQALRSNNAFNPKLPEGFCSTYHDKGKACTRDDCRFKTHILVAAAPIHSTCNSFAKSVQKKPTKPNKVEVLSDLIQGCIWVYSRIHAWFWNSRNTTLFS